MSIRAIMMGAYNSEGAKGIIGGSDRMAAVKAVAEAAGGSVNHVSFMRGRMDIIVDLSSLEESLQLNQYLNSGNIISYKR